MLKSVVPHRPLSLQTLCDPRPVLIVRPARESLERHLPLERLKHGGRAQRLGALARPRAAVLRQQIVIRRARLRRLLRGKLPLGLEIQHHWHRVAA